MSLWDDYEHQYAVLTAEITAKIGQLRLASICKPKSCWDGNFCYSGYKIEL